jgi:hypothetical protein
MNPKEFMNPFMAELHTKESLEKIHLDCLERLVDGSEGLIYYENKMIALDNKLRRDTYELKQVEDAIEQMKTDGKWITFSNRTRNEKYEAELLEELTEE